MSEEKNARSMSELPFPNNSIPEIMFLGRSNVGKSSLGCFLLFNYSFTYLLIYLFTYLFNTLTHANTHENTLQQQQQQQLLLLYLNT